MKFKIYVFSKESETEGSKSNSETETKQAVLEQTSVTVVEKDVADKEREGDDEEIKRFLY